jgi:hypothetical protein
MHLTGDNDRPAIYRRDLFHTTIEGNRRVTGFVCAQLDKLLAGKTRPRTVKLVGPLRPVRIEDWRGHDVRPDMLTGKFEPIHVPVGKSSFGNRVKPLQYVALRPGGRLAFKIHGHLAAISIVIGPYSGVVRCRVGNNVEVRNLFDIFCFADRIATYVPSPYPDLHEPLRDQEIIFEMMGSLPKDIQGPTPLQKPSKWTLGIVKLLVIGRLL